MAICGKCKREGVNLAHIKECYGVGDTRPANRAPNDSTWHDDNDPQNTVGEQCPVCGTWVVGSVCLRCHEGDPFFEGCDPKNDPVVEDQFPGEPVVVPWKASDPAGISRRVDVNVPFKDKEKAKELGAKWDPSGRTWFFIQGIPQNCPKEWIKTVSNQKNVITEGYWVLSGDQDVYYRVVTSRNGNLYAMRFEDGEDGVWEYAPGAMSVLENGNVSKLTVERAREYGRLYGRCMLCGRTLTDPSSIEAGIGPVCASKL